MMDQKKKKMKSIQRATQAFYAAPLGKEVQWFEASLKDAGYIIKKMNPKD